MFKKLIFYFSLFGILILSSIFLYQIYFPRVNAFGCFDDCFNYLGGYFLSKGKILYSQIFFNHQPLMAYLSQFIQLNLKLISIYDLLLKHRQTVFLFGILMDALLILRFGLAGLGFTFFYEFFKFYLFGDRFLQKR